MDHPEHCPSCGSCGFPMREPADFAGGQPGAVYCSTCGDDTGQLRPFDEVLQANANYLVRQQGLDPIAAREMAHALLAAMPAWQAGAPGRDA
ncbi:zinc ribbon domain-containing protein [Hydrogenophaga sp.]|uniref:zinc ribbon domain-containing protein n=1 Tax=Hydrogenophaga sp. TaxID=1904254 RepID=UPI00272F1440|nr:zinc ribbon domain-containing protein [Hydrogenophaga sp.]MDP1684976.1 zinc ribbon domain-containing protein [Hydrogenophaga sp.]